MKNMSLLTSSSDDCCEVRYRSWIACEACSKKLMAALKMGMLCFFSQASIHAKILTIGCDSRRYCVVDHEPAAKPPIRQP
jgi:hypothetical protein